MGIQVIDEVFGQAHSRQTHSNNSYFKDFATLTVKEFIAHRVEMEYERLLQDTKRELEKLQLDAPEIITDSWLWKKYDSDRVKVKPTLLSREDAVNTALAGFTAGAYFLFLDGRQVESLDERFVVPETKEVLFLRVTPLQGG